MGYINGLTERLYYHDSYLWDFDAAVISRSENGLRIELDRTAFYPSSGGQPFDLGTISGIDVVDVIDEEDRVVHVLGSPLALDGGPVACRIDSARRLDHMRQHTGQHVLSAVLEEEFKTKTVSFHMSAAHSTIDVEPQSIGPATLLEVERRVNERLMENASVSISFEDAATVEGLRKAPDREGLLRVVTIAALDRSACGGTHVRNSGEVGMIVLGKTEKIRKALRIEFYCGDRVRQAFRRRIDESEGQIHSLRERLAESDKTRKRLSGELAEFLGQQRFQRSSPDAHGRRVWVEELEELNEDARLIATSFLNHENTIVLLSGRIGAAVLFGAHPSLGMDCGKALKAALLECDGKGGGSAKLAQGSLSGMDKVKRVVQILTP